MVGSKEVSRLELEFGLGFEFGLWFACGVRVRVKVRVREPSSDATKEGEHLISSCRDVGA